MFSGKSQKTDTAPLSSFRNAARTTQTASQTFEVRIIGALGALSASHLLSQVGAEIDSSLASPGTQRTPVHHTTNSLLAFLRTSFCSILTPAPVFPAPFDPHTTKSTRNNSFAARKTLPALCVRSPAPGLSAPFVLLKRPRRRATHAFYCCQLSKIHSKDLHCPTQPRKRSRSSPLRKRAKKSPCLIRHFHRSF